MRDVCHRCHLELPHLLTSGPASASESILFCPHCSAPQIRLLEPMPTLLPVTEEADGNASGPQPQRVEWRLAVRCGAAVALTGAALTLIGFKLPAVSLVATLWIMSGAILTLGIYARQRPRAEMDTSIGLRIGLMAGLLMVAGIGTSLAMMGVVARFELHGMGAIDRQVSLQLDAFRAQIVTQLATQHQALDVQQKALGFVDSAEFRGGIAVVNLVVLGVILLLFSAAGGAFAGRLRAVRKRPPQHD